MAERRNFRELFPSLYEGMGVTCGDFSKGLNALSRGEGTVGKSPWRDLFTTCAAKGNGPLLSLSPKEPTNSPAMETLPGTFSNARALSP